MKSDNFVKRYLYYGQIDMPRSEAVKEKRPIILNDYELPRTNESQIMAIETIFLNSETSELKKRVKFLGSTRGLHMFNKNTCWVAAAMKLDPTFLRHCIHSQNTFVLPWTMM
ncbi:hypothetical protein P3L10_003327 [Capsicum annuum]